MRSSELAGGRWGACFAAARRSILGSNTGSRPLSRDPLGGGKKLDCRRYSSHRSAHHCHRTWPDCFYSVFSQTETWEVLSSVNGSRVQPAHRSRRVMPARRAIKSSSEGQT